jgi:hypothetical protein
MKPFDFEDDEAPLEAPCPDPDCDEMVTMPGEER